MKIKIKINSLLQLQKIGLKNNPCGRNEVVGALLAHVTIPGTTVRWLLDDDVGNMARDLRRGGKPHKIQKLGDFLRKSIHYGDRQESITKLLNYQTKRTDKSTNQSFKMPLNEWNTEF